MSLRCGLFVPRASRALSLLLTLLAVLGAAMSLSGCATSRGGALSRQAERDRQDRREGEERPTPRPRPPGEDRPSEGDKDNGDTLLNAVLNAALNPPPEPAGYEIQSEPSGAEVHLEGRLLGTTPLRIYDSSNWVLARRLNLSKAGHRPLETFLSHDGRRFRSHRFRLEPLWATLELGPEWGRGLARLDDGQVLLPGRNQVVSGLRTLRIERFGYEPVGVVLDLSEGEVQTLEGTWTPSAFRFAEVEVGPRRWAPAFERLRVRARVSVPGPVTFTVRDGAGRTVHSQQREAGEPWVRFTWDGLTEGRPAAPGVYSWTLSGGPGEAPAEETGRLHIDPAGGAQARSLFGPASGFLFSPSADVLSEAAQFGLFALGAAEGDLVLVPLGAGLRLGLPEAGLELLASAASRLWSDPYLNSWTWTLGTKGRLTDPASAPLQAAWYGAFSLSGFYDADTLIIPQTDPFTNPAGFKGGLALDVPLGPLTLTLAPEAVLAFRDVSYTPGVTTEGGPLAYLRGALSQSGPAGYWAVSGALLSRFFRDEQLIARPYKAGFEFGLRQPEGLTWGGAAALDWFSPNQWTLSLGLQLLQAGLYGP